MSTTTEKIEAQRIAFSDFVYVQSNRHLIGPEELSQLFQERDQLKAVVESHERGDAMLLEMVNAPTIAEGITKLKAENENLKHERNAIAAKVRGEWIAKMKVAHAEKEQAEKACAEMRDDIKEIPELNLGNYNDDEVRKVQNAALSAYQTSQQSTCGQDYIHRDTVKELEKNSSRLHWLHDCSTGQTDQYGYEWGIYRVKWDNGHPIDVCQTNSDFSDLDAEMSREALAKFGGEG